MQQTLAQSSRVLIVGGGISGLALGQSLSRSHIPFTVFERDPSASFRPQGYRISHNPKAEEALKSLVGVDLYGTIRAMGTGDLNTPGLVMADAVTGENLGPMPGLGGPSGGKAARVVSTESDKPRDPPGDVSRNPPSRPPAFQSDRTVLRGLLGLNLEPHISYGKKFVDFSPAKEGRTILARFEDGTSEEGAMIVGCDGVRSKVYSNLLGALDRPRPTLLDLERRTIYGKTRFTRAFVDAFPEAWRNGVGLFKDPNNDTKFVFTDAVKFRNRAEDATGGRVKTPEDYLYWAFVTKPEDFAMTDKELFSLSPDQTAELSLKMTMGWDHKLRAMFEHQDISQCSVLSIQSAHPDIQDRPSHPHVTIMGDAIHPMSPTGGAGANTALRDAALLASLLKSAWNENEGWTSGAIGGVIQDYDGQSRSVAKEVLNAAFNTPFAKVMMGGTQPEEYTKSVSY
ncbi:MAG: hypothetical protein TREMPRED_001101 [Tremellales sp. Tagirdzhanova-0007]|nr:MAG: hypothetical protein TREMPRED_001101 [Tremellales sp. Tagirdzhanova-0007]